MKWRFFRQYVASKLRLAREILSGLQDTGTQIISRSRHLAPSFLYEPLGPVSEKEVLESIELIRAKFGPDYLTNLRNARRYSELFFLDYFESKDRDPSERSKKLKLAIQCEENHTPFQNLLFRIYQRDFRTRHRDALRSFQDRYRAVDLLVLHLSCNTRAPLASRSAATFVDSGSHIANVIVVGHDSEKSETYSLSAADDLLVVPANDAYEGLAEKSAAAYAFLAFSGITTCVLKVDDDIRCLKVSRLMRDVLPLGRSAEYVGRVWHAMYGITRSWHFGKCQDPVLNAKPYGLLADTSYAEGPAYFLSPRAIQVLGKSSVYLEELFETEKGYEDIAVGKVLNHYGIRPVNYDFIEAGILDSTDRWSRQLIEAAQLIAKHPEKSEKLSSEL